MRKLVLSLLLVPALAWGQAPTTSNLPVTRDALNNWLPAMSNGHVPNLPAGTTVDGLPIGGGDVSSTETLVTSGTPVVFDGVTGKLIRAATSDEVLQYTDPGYNFLAGYDTSTDLAVPYQFSNDGTLASNSATTVPSEQAVRVAINAASFSGLFADLDFTDANYHDLPGLQDAIDGAGGSFLSANTARVDPSGDDATGTIGDLGKPFLTAQAAFTAYEAIPSPTGTFVLVVGNFNAGDVTTAIDEVYVVGLGLGTDSALGLITLTADGASFCCWGIAINNVTGQNLYLNLDDASCGHLTSDGSVTVLSPAGEGVIGGDVTATGTVRLSKLACVNGTISSPGNNVYLDRVAAKYSSGTLFQFATIDSAGSEVWASSSLFAVTSCGTLHLTDSRVVGTNNATSTVYEDVLLADGPTVSHFGDPSGTALQILRRNAANDGFEFADPAAGGVTDVTGTAPIASSGGATPAISLAASTNSVDGYLSAADHTTFTTASTDRLKWDGGSTGLVAATGRTSLGLVIGTDVQAYDSDLTIWAGITPGTGVATALAVATNAAGGFSPIDGTATLTNKTISKASNTLTGVAGSGANTDITSLALTGHLTNSFTSLASDPALYLTGSWLTGSTGTANFPHLLLQATGTTASTTWNTAGTAFGVNAVTGFTGNLIDLKLAGTSKFTVTSAGATTVTGAVSGVSYIATGGNFNAPSGFGFVFSASSRIKGDTDGVINLSNNATSAFTGLDFGNSTNSFGRIGRDAVNGFTLQSAAGTSTWNDASTANSGTVANRYLFGIAAPTLTSTGTSVTNTVASTVYIGGAPTDSTNTTSTTKWALNVAGGNTNIGGGLILGVQALSGTGAVNLTTASTAFTSTAAANALTLANGTEGQRKSICHVSKGALGTGILTPTTANGFTTITFTNAGDSVELEYHATNGWCIIGSRGVTIT